MTKLILPLLISAIISFILTPFTKKFFINHGWVEDPVLKQRKTGNATALTPVPRGGGLPIFIAIAIPCFLLLPHDKHLIGIFLAAAIALLVGLWDDIKDISPLLRIFSNILVALVVVGFGIGIAYISNPLGGVIDLSQPQINFSFLGFPHSIWLISDLLAIIWIVWCTNTVGWSAGVEGQLPGFVFISALFIGLVGLRYSTDITQWPLIVLAGAVAGAYLGFLPHNFHPQQIMPGYSGKSLAGFFLALLAILSGAKLATVILLLGIPTIDAIFVLFRRLLLHRSLLHPNSIHLHHYLLKIGWSRPQIAITYWLFSFILGFLSLFLNSRQKLYLFICLICLFLCLLILIYRRIYSISNR